MTSVRRQPKVQMRLSSRLMMAQALVIFVGGVTLVLSAAMVAPGLFHEHLMDAGVYDSQVQTHAEEAFASSFAVSVLVAAGAALIAAGVVSLLLVRRVSQPVEELARAAEAVAVGRFDVDVPDATFSRELHQLSASFQNMAHRLDETETSRISLLADLAHELRTPLATLEAYIDGMEDGVVATESAAWETMRAQVDRLRRLAADLKETAAAEEHALGLVLEYLDVRGVAAASIHSAAPRYKTKGVLLSLHQSPEPCWVRGDGVRLAQVLANLLDNALRHTPVEGRVDVLVERNGDQCRVCITDTGEGIPAEELEAVFQRFHRADPSRVSNDGGGSGLGLTIARAIVVDHGGSLVAVSTGAFQGATFTVVLPLTIR